MKEVAATPSDAPRLSTVLHSLASDVSRDRIAVDDLLGALGHRALPALLFLFAVPNAVPMPPGTSTLLGAPLVFLAAQLAIGRPAWRPPIIARRTMARRDFAGLVRRVAPWLVRAEALLRPRVRGLVMPPMQNLVGLVCLLLAVVLLLPIPLGNMLPAFAITLLALAILESDGVCVLAGPAGAAVSISVVSGVILAMVSAALYFIT